MLKIGNTEIEKFYHGFLGVQRIMHGNKKIYERGKGHNRIEHLFPYGESPAYIQNVPNGVKQKATIKKICGHSVKITQHVPTGEASELSTPSHRVDSIAFNAGTKIYKTHKYLFRANLETSDEIESGYVEIFIIAKVVDASEISLTRITSNTSTSLSAIFSGRFNLTSDGTTEATKGNFYIMSAIAGIPQTGLTATITDINLIDLTEWFGSGREPRTTEEAYAMGVPRCYIQYNSGGIVNADVESIDSYDDETLVDSISIPSAIRELPLYGASAMGVCNEVDFKYKKYYQRVFSVDLGDLTWTKGGTVSGSMRFFLTDDLRDVIILPKSETDIGKIVCYGYDEKPIPKSFYDGYHDKIIGVWYDQLSSFNGEICIYDPACEDMTPEQFKTYVTGKIMYYAKKESIMTDISALIPNNMISVESGGTIKFSQSETEFELPNKVQYRKEVD